MRMYRIGVISDTHGLLRPEIDYVSRLLPSSSIAFSTSQVSTEK
jgi:hypothetical protein